MRRFLLCLALVSLLACGVFAQVTPAPPLMNFQGRLAKPDGTPVSDGTYSVRFSLWDAATNGTEKWNQTVNPVNVKNGTFAVLLNVNTPNLFDADRWLEIKIGTDAPLAPRQQLVSVAFALKANSVPDGSISTAQIANGSITADKFASNLLNPLVWLLGGNSGTNPSANFLGTTDNQPLVFKVNNSRALRLEWAMNIYDTTNGYYWLGSNTIGGYGGNSVRDGVVAGTIGGGGIYDSTGPREWLNRVTSGASTVSGGIANTAGDNNTDRTNARYATVGGGGFNTASAISSTVGGGVVNTASNDSATVAGGNHNTASNESATVGGGIGNAAIGNSATVGGGDHNTASDDYATVGGGTSNVASGFLATVGGGWTNTAAGSYSFAAGQQAQANHDGTFVWNDASNPFFPNLFASTGVNQFLIHASGGVGINTNNPAGYALNVNGNANFTGFITVNGTFYFSDARYKQHIAPFDNALDAILNLRGVTFDWNRDAWKGRNFPEGKQVGFIAQEVEKVLPELVSTDTKGYKSVAYANVVPVLVEAMKQQQKQIDALKAKNERIGKVEAENAELKAKLDALAAAVAELKAQRK